MCFGLVCFCVSIVFVVLVFFFLVRLVFCIFFFDILVGLFCSSFLLCCLLLVLIRFLGDLALRLLDSILSKNDAIMGFSWFFWLCIVLYLLFACLNVLDSHILCARSFCLSIFLSSFSISLSSFSISLYIKALRVVVYLQSLTFLKKIKNRQDINPWYLVYLLLSVLLLQYY